MTRLSFLIILLVSLGGLPGRAESVRIDAAGVLRRAFDLIYGSDQIRIAKVTVKNAVGDTLFFTVQLASKSINGHLHTYGLFTEPPRLRNMAILTIEADDRIDDHFLYLPASGRVRRISSAQRSDTFMGTDLTYEDFERRHESDYQVESVRMSTSQNEPTYEIRATPRYRSGVNHIVFHIATRDYAILEVQSFKRGAERPFRVLRAPRESMVRISGKVLPTKIIVENLARRTVTEVAFEQLRIVDTLSDSLFSSKNLALRRQVPGLIREYQAK